MFPRSAAASSDINNSQNIGQTNTQSYSGINVLDLIKGTIWQVDHYNMLSLVFKLFREQEGTFKIIGLIHTAYIG